MARKTFAGLLRRYRISLLMGALVVIVCVAVFGRDRKLPVELASPRLVRSFTVISAQGGVAEYTGVIHARTESDLGFRVPGKILEKLVKAGDHVKRGQALMRLDPTDLRLGANAAQAAVEAARALRISSPSRTNCENVSWSPGKPYPYRNTNGPNQRQTQQPHRSIPPLHTPCK